MRVFKSPNLDFLKHKWIGIGVSAVAMVITTISLIAKGGPNFGIDFTGGANIIYAFAKPPDENAIRKVVEGANVQVTSVQRFDKPEKGQILLRVPQDAKEGRDMTKEVTAALTKALFPGGLEAGKFDLNLNGADVLLGKLIAEDPEKLAGRPSADPKIEYGRTAQAIIDARSAQGLFRTNEDVLKTPGLSPAVAAWLKEKAVAGPFTLLSAESVGPQVGKDLREKGMWAVILSWAAMLVYIAVRFRSAPFGVTAVIALVHDTYVTLGLCSILNTEISLTVVAAFLTLVGYSVNDTVVIFDRIRENRNKSKKGPLDEIVNRSINETLSRTVLTSGLTFLVVVALFVFGGAVLRGFSLVMLAGIIVGSYSTVFIAAPLIVVWDEWKAKRGNGAPAPVAASGPKGKLAASRK